MKTYICSLSVNEHIFCMLKRNLSKIQSYVFYLNVCQICLLSSLKVHNCLLFFFFPCWNYRFITVYLLRLFWYFLLVYALTGIRCANLSTLLAVLGDHPPIPRSWLVFSWWTVKHCFSTESTSLAMVGHLARASFRLPI